MILVHADLLLVNRRSLADRAAIRLGLNFSDIVEGVEDGSLFFNFGEFAIHFFFSCFVGEIIVGAF